MKLGIVAGVFAPAPIEDVLDQVVRHGFEAVELPTGNYGGTPCVDLDSMVGNPPAIRGLRAAVEARGLTISALSCQGNPLHPRDEVAGSHHDVLMKTLRLAADLGVDVVNVFSGCPGAGVGSRYPSWVSCAWPPDFLEVLEWQWREKLIPYWRSVVAETKRLGVSRLAMEPMPGFMVYNTRTLLELRNAVGPEVGANLDPSHLFWQGIDPCVAIRELGAQGAVFYFHAKDTFVDPAEMARNGVFETRPYDRIGERSWFFRAVGCGHAAETWDRILLDLRRIGYDGTVSIEHEDASFSKSEGISRAVTFLKDRIFREPLPKGIWWG
jgi:sugar phosphate isomerase/epimerase